MPDMWCKIKPYLLFCLLVVFICSISGCRDKYAPVFTNPETGYLVVEGFINTSGITSIKLSRTTPLSERGIIAEKNAVLRVEGDDNSSFALFETEEGKYVSEYRNLNNNTQFRLYIKTQQNKEYVSDYRPVLQQPGIDSLSWERHYGGLDIFVNARGNEQDAKRFKWEYYEVWEYRSSHLSSLKLMLNQNGSYAWVEPYDPVHMTYDSTNYICWKDRYSSSIILGNTVKLTGNTIHLPVKFYPEKAWELNQLYFIHVKQTALTEEGYSFYEKMKKNTESLGSIFDPQPSETGGNISCLTVPREQVVGFIEATSEKEKTMYIRNSDLPDWGYYDGCITPTIVENTSGTIIEKVVREEKLPLAYVADGKAITITDKICVDCRVRGGTTKRPSFWPK